MSQKSTISLTNAKETGFQSMINSQLMTKYQRRYNEIAPKTLLSR